MSLEDKRRILAAREAVGDDPTALHEFMVDPIRQTLSGVTIHGNVPFTVPFVSQIDGNLWQGGCENGLVLPKTFKHLISLYPWERYTVEHDLDSILVVRMYDSDDEIDIEQLLAVADWVTVCMKSGPSLVHCQAGLNRSSLVTAMVLMMNNMDLTGEDAINILREKRSPACLCNRTFEKFVREWKWVKS